jgi:hypothetical protein
VATQENLRDLALQCVNRHGEGETNLSRLTACLFRHSIAAARTEPPTAMAAIPLSTLASELNMETTAVSGVRVRLNEKLDILFDREEGSTEEYRVTVTKGTIGLRFAKNPTPDRDPIQVFWKAYLDAGEAIVYYPEPQFFKDDNNTYFRNHTLNDEKNLGKARQLFRLKGSEGIEPSQSFVPSGFVRSVVQLFQCFASQRKLRMTAHPIRWADTVPNLRHHHILLGTSSSVNVLSKITDVFPVESYRDDSNFNAIRIRDSKRVYRDDNHTPNQDSADLLRKWVVVTRRRVADGRFATVLAGHSRAVEGAVNLFTDCSVGGLDLRHVADAFGPRPELDGEFQVLLGAQMAWDGGNLNIRRMFVEGIVDDEGPFVRIPVDPPAIDGKTRRGRKP